MFNKELEETLRKALMAAKEKRHEFITIEHLLLSLLDNYAAGNVLQACDANIEALRRDLIEFIDETTPRIPENDFDRETHPTIGFQRVLQRAVFQVQASGKLKSVERMFSLPFLMNKTVRRFISYAMKISHASM